MKNGVVPGLLDPQSVNLTTPFFYMAVMGSNHTPNGFKWSTIGFPIGSMYAIYCMATFTINIPPMLAYIPYMDFMGWILLGFRKFFLLKTVCSRLVGTGSRSRLLRKGYAYVGGLLGHWIVAAAPHQGSPGRSSALHLLQDTKNKRLVQRGAQEYS